MNSNIQRVVSSSAQLLCDNIQYNCKQNYLFFINYINNIKKVPAKSFFIFGGTKRQVQLITFDQNLV